MAMYFKTLLNRKEKGLADKEYNYYFFSGAHIQGLPDRFGRIQQQKASYSINE
ncbi:MAG: hypothetical protein J0H85_16120 [Sediminibacterium magnilacihabitans]|jgi:hypothetical protein|nr:hypothetical protein [Sediminibacterium magnilacihabitans]PQV58053.1 hypothetical protein CLV53_12440 [Sediminibacterium magnilacihabitans]